MSNAARPSSSASAAAITSATAGSPYELFSPHGEIVAQRIATLNRLPALRQGVLVLPAATLLQRLAPRSYLAQSGLQLALGQHLDLDAEIRRLEAGGYRRVPQVGDAGEFAVRGAVLDIYPSGAPQPFRIELLDDSIDSLRSFDAETQRSLHGLTEIKLLPAREFPLTEEAIRAFRARLRERFAIDLRNCPLYQDLREGSTPAGIEYYLPLFFAQCETLFDYLDARAVFVLDVQALPAAERFWQQTGERHAQRAHDASRPILPPGDLYLSPDELRAALNRSRRVDLQAETREHTQVLPITPAPQMPPATHGNNAAQTLAALLQPLAGPVLLAADSPGRRELLRELLAAGGHHAEPVSDCASWLQAAMHGTAPALALTVAALSAGFALPEAGLTVLSEQELAGERVRQEHTRRRRAARDPETVLRDLTELTTGAPIVPARPSSCHFKRLSILDPQFSTQFPIADFRSSILHSMSSLKLKSASA